MTHPLTDAAARRVIHDRLSCDYCGDDLAELRSYSNQGYTPDDIVCAGCFPSRDPHNDFTDFPLAQGAAQ